MTTTVESSATDSRDVDTTADERHRQLTRIAEEVGDLPALPEVAMRALKLAKREDWSIVELENEIVRDHALAARLLRLANSPYFGAWRSITTVARALNLIGNGARGRGVQGYLDATGPLSSQTTSTAFQVGAGVDIPVWERLTARR